MGKSAIRRFVCLASVLVMGIGSVFSQSVVNVGSDLFSTKYYKSMNASNPPTGEWYAMDYDDSAWESYTGPMEYPEYYAFWIRRVFTITDDPENHTFRLQLSHDDTAEIYINGQLIHSCGGCGRYNYFYISGSYLVQGSNLLAVYVNDYGGDQNLECYFTTDDSSDIIKDMPREPMFYMTESSVCLYYGVEGYSDYQLNVMMMTPAGKANTPISWTSSNANAAIVKNGKIQALAAGKAVVTASTVYDGVTYTKECAVEVRVVDPKSKVVVVNEPGTLGTLLTDDDKDNVDDLTIIGKLNGADIQVLRYMAGRTERGNRSPGTLTNLDIYNVQFVNEGISYFRFDSNNTSGVSAGRLPSYMFYSCGTLNSIILPKSVVTIGNSAFSGCTNLEKIVLPDNLSVIESDVFSNCSNLKSFEIPVSVKSLGGSVFSNCTKLESIKFADNTEIEEINGWTFHNTNLESITIPASVVSVREYAFCNNNNLTAVTFEEGSKLVEILYEAFSNCSKLNEIKLPEGCLEIGDYSFRDCRNMVSVTVPVSMVSIGKGAFANCSQLMEVNIPDNSKLTSIGSDAFANTAINSFYIPKNLLSISDIFSGSNQIQNLTVHPDSRYYEVLGGIVYSKRDKSVVLVPKTMEGFLSFPDYVTNLPENLLQGCSRLKGIILHSGITSIGDNTFSGCSGLQTLMILSSTPVPVTDASLNGINKSTVTLVVPQGAADSYRLAQVWSGFENIVEVSNEPIILLSADNVTVYDVDYEFARKSRLSVTVITKDGISTVPVSWSTSDANVAKVTDGVIEYVGSGTATITASVTIGDYTASSTCTVNSIGMIEGKMVYVSEPGTLSTLLTDTEKDDLTHLIVMGSINNDDMRILRYMAGRDEYGNLTVGSLEVLDMEKARIVGGGKDGYYYRDNWWRSVGDDYFSSDVFHSCYSLKKVVLPSTLRNMESYAFSDCKNLEEVIIPEGLTNIGYEAFGGCIKLAKVNIPSSVTNLSGWIFNNCKSLKTIDLSTMTGVNTITDYMFNESGLTSIRIPAHITSIMNNAFQNTPLSKVEFEEGSRLMSIGDGAFQSTKLQSITIPASVTSINNYAFNDCRQLKDVSYADNSMLNAIGDGAFNGCPLEKFIIPKRLISLGYQDFQESMSQIVIDENNKFFECVDGILYCKADNSVVYVPKDKSSLYLPDYVTTMRSGVLRYHYNLRTVVLTTSMTDLGDEPFFDDYNLTEVYCMNPEPPTVRNLNNAWSGKIYIPAGSRKNYEDANWELSMLEERSYSNSISISATQVKLYNAMGGNEQELLSTVFSASGPVPSYTVSWASTNTSVVTVDNDGKITYAGPGTAKVTASVMLNGAEYSAECQVTAVELADPAHSYYLNGNGNLRSLISQDKMSDIDKLVLVGKMADDDRNMIRELCQHKLTWLDMENLSDTVVYSFEGCSSLSTIILPANTVRIEGRAFAWCNNLSSIQIPASVRTIEWEAFADCSLLRVVRLYCAEAPDLNGTAFNGTPMGLMTIIIPAGSTGYQTKDYWRDLTNIYSTDMLPMLFLKNEAIELYNVEENGAKTDRLTAFVITENGITSSGISWASSDTAVVKVDNDGTVHAGAAEGDAVITASYTGNGKTVSSECTVSVVDITGYKFVNVTVAGTLSGLLTEEEMIDTRKLIVSGDLNNDDIRLLRYMAGRDEFGNLTAGSLEVLNMSKARIVSGGKDGFYYRDNWWRYVGDDYFGSDVFRSCYSLKKVVLPSTLRTMESYAFSDCKNLEEVIIPEGLTNIGYEAFGGCTKLAKVNLPSSVTSLSGWIFNNCKSLKTIDLSTMTGVNTITDYMFNESGLTSIRIPAHITSIMNNAFQNTPLSKVEFEEGSKLLSIGDGAFQSTKLQSITIPASVTRINNYAFNDCRQLKDVRYGDNSMLNAIGEGAFNGCPIATFVIPRRLISLGRQDFSESLAQIVIEEGNQFFEIYDDALCSKAEGSLLYVPKRKKSLYLPDYVTTLKDGVLQFHYDLQMVVLPYNITDLGDSPFYQCTNLKEIYCMNPVSPASRNLTNDFPQATVYIAEGSRETYIEAGWDDWRITLVEHSFTNSLSLATAEQILYNVDGANKIRLEAKVFSTNGPLPNAAINWISSDPEVVTVDGNGMLSYTGQGQAVITASVILDGTEYSDKCVVNTRMIENTENTTFIFVETAGNLPNQITAAEKKTITNLVVFGSINGTDIRFIREMARIPYAYWDETPAGSLEYLDLSGATIVEGGDDYGYAEWQDELGRGYGEWVYTKNNVIGKSMFRSSPTLKTIILPNNITAIDLYAFRDCKNLESVVLPKSLSFIDNDAFNNCPLLTQFVIPESIDSLGANALRGFDEIHANSSVPVKILSYYLISDDAIVIVPAYALQEYRSAVNWKQFAGQIMPDNLNIQTVAVLDVTAQDEGSGLLIAAGGDDALAFIKDLTLRGTINGYDIAMIRNRMPRLHYLDLTDTRIVANPYEYYTDSHTEKNRLGRNAFRELNKLYKVALPKTIDYIGEYAFYHCENLTSVTMYKGVNTIDYGSFAECFNLVKVELPEGLQSIGFEAFRSCNSLEEIELPSSLLALGWSAFADCYNLKSVVLPKNLSAIEGSTFWYCNNLESVVLPAKVYRIDGHAFYGCSKLKELRLPPMIESIGDRAFYECNSIKDVYVYIANSKDIKIDMNTFSCWTSATLHIPSFSYSSYFWDTQWGQFYSKVEFQDTYDEFYTKNTLTLNQETGTIQGDPSAVLYENGGLVVDSIEQVLDVVELKSNGEDGASLIASGTGNIVASKLSVVINVTEYKWHFFCFPFDIPLDSIHYEGEYVWRQYDGEARSRREGGWQDLPEGTVQLDKGRGYIFQGTLTGSLSFTVDNPDLSAKDESTSLFSYDSKNAQDANWNFVGNPYTAYFNIDETTYSAPITVWTGSGYEAYRPGDDVYDLSPYQAFFVQTPYDTDSINFSAEGRESYGDKNGNMVARRAALKRAANPDRLFINLEVTANGDESYTDKTRIVFNNSKSMDYEQNCDAAKFFSESRSIELYSLDSNGAMYSINERPVDNGVVELGIVVNREGSYTIDAVRMDIPVLLIDNELNYVYDLSKGGYSFEAETGESQRFTLKLGDETQTKVTDVRGADTQDVIYDLNGRILNDSKTDGIIIRNGRKEITNY